MAGHRFVISGYYGFGNAGDEAMLFSILRLLEARFPGSTAIVISGNPEKTKEAFSVGAVSRFAVWDILKVLKGADALISGGGSLLQNVTSWKSLLYYLSIIFCGTVFSKNVFLFAQGIGPIRHRWVEKVLRMILSRTDGITVRDQASKDFLKRIGVTGNVNCTADPVLSLPMASLEPGREILDIYDFKGDKKLIGVSVRYWMGANAWAHSFRKYMETLNKHGEYEFVFIPMQHPEDKYIAQKICEGIPHTHVLRKSYNTEELMSIIGNMDLLIGVRLHALIFSSLMHVPFIGISYDPKIDNFLQAVAMKAVFSLDNFDAEKLVAQTKLFLNEESKELDWSRVEALHRKAYYTIDLLEKVVKE